MTDKNEIIRALNLWYQPGDVFEVRVLDAVTAEWMRPHMESGYFDYEHIPAAADAIGKLRSYRGAYATINPVKPDLLARACNRIRGITREPTTADSDIAERRWLLIDCDPKRVSGVSSTDEEHEAALEKARELRDDMTSVGWSQPVITDSGNGAQMLYRISLPADDNGLVQRTVEALTAATNDSVEIDSTVHNPARIWRIPGTMNCKGDSIPIRPHRMAKLISVPKRLAVITREQLEQVANYAAVSYPSEPLKTVTDGFNIDRWLAQYCPDLGSPQPWKGGRKWIFPVCPFNDAHRNRSAVLIQEASGAIAFKCHHNGCAGNDWKKLRELKEPGCYQPRKTTFSEEIATVDISGILCQNIKNKKPVSNTLPGCLPFPEELYDVPGFVGEVIRFMTESTPYPNKGVAFAAALALQAHLAARKVETPLGARTNPYIIALARSGSGKDHPRKVNRRILCQAGIGNEVQDNIASAQGLEDALLVHPAMLWQSDEFYAVLREIVNDKTGTKESMMKYLLTFFTSANEIYTTRSKAGQPGVQISCPNLTLLGTCTPGLFFSSIDDRVLAHGMYSRMTVIQADSLRKKTIPTHDFRNLTESIEKRAKAWADYRPAGSGNTDLKAAIVPVTKVAEKIFDAAQDEADMEYEQIRCGTSEEWKLAIWSRAFESLTRFSLIYACSASNTPEQTVITEDAVLWAKKFIWWECRNKIAMTEYYYHESDFEKYAEEVIAILVSWVRRKGLDTPMPGWMFNRRTRKFPPNVLNAVLKSLEAQERIAIQSVQGDGRSGKAYILLDDSVK